MEDVPPSQGNVATDFPQVQGSRGAYPPPPVLHHQTSSNLPELQQQYEHSVVYSDRANSYKMLIKLVKIIAAIVILATSDTCFSQGHIFLVLMACYDALHVYFCILIAQIIRAGARAARLGTENTANRPAGAGATENQAPESEALLQNEDDDVRVEIAVGQDGNARTLHRAQTIHVARDITRKQRIIDRFSGVAELFYLGIWIWGIVIVAKKNNLECFDPHVHNLALAWVILGAIGMLLPCFLCCLGICCLPVLIFVLLIVGPPSSQVAADHRLVSKLRVQKYDRNLPGDHTCSICMEDYKEGDDIVQFTCSEMHHFHDSCIKRWLRVNGECPMCRTRLEDMHLE